jgi:putative NADH-flavin reductase
MRVTVFGAAGKTGRLVVEEAVRRGIEVTALVRDPSRASFDRATVRLTVGDAREAGVVAEALPGSDAAISVMAIPSGTDPTTDLSDGAHVIVSAMEAQGPGRLIVTVNSSVFHDRPVKPPYDVVAQEHRRVLAILRASALDWTALAPTFLTDDEPAGTYRVEPGGKAPGAGIPRGDLAVAALEAIGHDDWFGQVLGIST